MTADERPLPVGSTTQGKDPAAAPPAFGPERDSLSRLLATARIDDEPLTAEDEAALTEADADSAAGRVVSWGDLRDEIT